MRCNTTIRLNMCNVYIFKPTNVLDFDVMITSKIKLHNNMSKKCLIHVLFNSQIHKNILGWMLLDFNHRKNSHLEFHSNFVIEGMTHLIFLLTPCCRSKFIVGLREDVARCGLRTWWFCKYKYLLIVHSNIEDNIYTLKFIHTQDDATYYLIKLHHDITFD